MSIDASIENTLQPQPSVKSAFSPSFDDQHASETEINAIQIEDSVSDYEGHYIEEEYEEQINHEIIHSQSTPQLSSGSKQSTTLHAISTAYGKPHLHGKMARDSKKHPRNAKNGRIRPQNKIEGKKRAKNENEADRSRSAGTTFPPVDQPKAKSRATSS